MNSKKYKNFVKKQDKPIAFVLYLGGTGLGVIRSLGRQGIPVIGLDPDPTQVGHFSKYCKGIVCPDPEKNEILCIDFLMKLGEQLNTRGVLIPAADKYVLAIARHSKKLEKYYRIPMAQPHTIETLVDKGKFYSLLEEMNLPHPKTYYPKDMLDVERIVNEVAFPCIIKPVFSHKFFSTFRVKAFKANSTDELLKSYIRAKKDDQEIVIQELIPGVNTDNYIVNAYFNQISEPLGIFTHRVVRQYPLNLGTSPHTVSVWIPEIAEMCISFLKKIKYQGLMDADIRRDPRDNKFKFIEINARVGWQSSLAMRCGVNLSYLAYMDAIGKDNKTTPPQREGIKWLYMFDDLRSSAMSMLRGQLSPISYMKSLRGEKEYAIFAWDDPYPFFVSFPNLASAAFSKFASLLKSVIRT